MGLSEKGLGRLHDVLAGHVERRMMPGAVALVSRRGETHVEVLGTMELDGDRPMRRDTIFRVASMTKPVVAVAALMLVEECRLRLDEPLDALLPELADRQVLTELDAPLDDTVPAQRPLTLRDLLTFRNGFGMLTGPQTADYPIQAAARERQLAGGMPDPGRLPGPDEWLRRLGELPLMAQPGEKWLYNTGSDILGVLIARVTGQSLEAFLRERIFEPLGMRDTAFSVPETAVDRFPSGYVAAMTGEISLSDPAAGSSWTTPPAFQSGAGGLVSTVDDFFAFATMMLNLGTYDGERLLSRLSVQAMITDQLTPAQKAVSGFLPGYFDNLGWGFGVAVVTGRDSVSSVPGRFGWDGGYGTSWWSDPVEDLTGILLTQRGAFPLMSPPYLDFWTSAYQAIDD